MAEAKRSHVLVAGLSTRALAVSAARAGYQVTAADGFGDRDLEQVAEVIRTRVPERPFHPGHAAALAARVPAELATYVSSFENYPRAVERLGRGRVLLGNSPAVLKLIREPLHLMQELRRQGVITPDTLAARPAGDRARRTWLVKPRRSGGGHGIASWRPEDSLPRGAYLQERIPGAPGSIVFAADGRNAVPLGVCLQLVGDVRFGASGFRYCGSILASSSACSLFPYQDALVEAAAGLAQIVTRTFGLVGLNGIDFIARRGRPYPLEVNPRYSASMELFERATGASIFEIHARACGGTIPPLPPLPGDALVGKAIVFARRGVRMGDTDSWSRVKWLADVPHSGERISRGRPICTVFAQGTSRSLCLRRLLRRAAAVYRFAESTSERAA